MSAIPPLSKPPFLQQFQDSTKFTASWCWVHKEICYPTVLVSSQASDQTWALPPWAIFTARGETGSLGYGSSHPKVNACCALMSSDPTWSILGECDSWFLRMAVNPWSMDQSKRFPNSRVTSENLKPATCKRTKRGNPTQWLTYPDESGFN